MEFTEAVGVTGISVICYLIGLAVKLSPLGDKYIPLVCGISGGALGALGLFIMPEFPAGDILNAVAVGIVSGLAATGADQLVKQLSIGRADR